MDMMTELEKAIKRRDELGDALMQLLYDLHPMYGNTSRRGRGIGGQAITRQCNYLDPEGEEVEQIEAIELLLRDHLINDRGM